MSKNERQKKRMEKLKNNGEYEDYKKKRAKQRRLSRKKSYGFDDSCTERTTSGQLEIRAKITQALKKGMSDNFSFCCH